MSDSQIAWMDREKFGEVFRETSVVRLNLSLQELEDAKRRLVEWDEAFKDVELSWIKDFLDLYNSIFVAVKNYHIKYDLNSNNPIPKEVVKPTIPANNKERHKLNKLKPFATLDEKVKRHIDHVANCKCWPLPRYVKKEIQKRLG